MVPLADASVCLVARFVFKGPVVFSFISVVVGFFQNDNFGTNFGNTLF